MTQKYLYAGLAWLLFLAGLFVYEMWALRDPAIPTLSAWVWKTDAALPWFRYAVLGGVAVLMWHFFYQRRRTP